MSNEIHPTAIVHDSVRLGSGNYVGPFAVLTGELVIGDGNWIGPHAVIGTAGEHRSRAAGDLTGSVRMGDANTIREFVVVNAGVESSTVLGSHIYLMDKAHVGHDCTLEDGVTLTCNVMLGGHAYVGAEANLGLGAVIHQRTVIGAGAMVGMGSVVRRHVAPFAMCIGNPARTIGPNQVGLERAGWDATTIDKVADAISGRGSADLLPEPLRSNFADYGRTREHLEG